MALPLSCLPWARESFVGERERERERKRERVHLPKLTSIKDISFPLSYIAFAARERERMRVPGRDRENEKRE